MCGGIIVSLCSTFDASKDFFIYVFGLLSDVLYAQCRVTLYDYLYMFRRFNACLAIIKFFRIVVASESVVA